MHTELRDKIRDNYKSLSNNLQLVADFFIDNFDKIPFLSVHEVADSSGASVASVVRFAQQVGFSGYSEIREEVAGNIQDHLEGKDKFSLIDQQSDKEDILTTVANQDIKNINNTFRVIEKEKFMRAIELIVDAEAVMTAGLGISYLLSRILAYQLNQVGIKASAFRHDTSPFLEQALLLNQKELLILLSFPPYSEETIKLAEHAHNNGHRIVSITNKHAAPITFHSDVCLIVKSENMLFTNSFAAISVLINAITTEIAYKDRSGAMKMIKKLEEIQKDLTLSKDNKKS
jgi:DNA-binding MurR/RpiR family transcriptional regulator